MSARAMRLIAAIFTNEEDATGALKRIGSDGKGRAWLASATSQPESVPAPVNVRFRTLLQGEQLVAAEVEIDRVEEAVALLGRVGTPAVFILPEIPPEEPHNHRVPSASHSLTAGMECLAQK